MQLNYEALIIGSGFGGAIACCRLARRWPGKVLLLERGKRWPRGSFPRSPTALADALWNPHTLGLFDLRNQKGMDLVVGAGLGGGSLIYANVFLPPPPHCFRQGWPAELDGERLTPYYEVARQVLNAQPLPAHQRVGRSQRMEAFARSQGRPCHPAELCVHFGQPGQPPGTQTPNRFGAVQSTCLHCGECDLGCNVHAKNSLDLNYLHVAEKHHGAKISTGALAEKIVPLNPQGQESPDAEGRHGYAIYYRTLPDGKHHRTTAQRVVVAAGTLGTVELLLRCREQYRTLPRLSPALGRNFSGNGDFVAFLTGTQEEEPPNEGPVITRWMDYHLFQDPDPDKAFIVEDAAYPAFLAWYLEGMRPALDPLSLLRKGSELMTMLWHRWLRRGSWTGSMGHQLGRVMRGSYSGHTRILLCMGVDQAQGRLFLKNGELALRWSHSPSRRLYRAQEAMGRAFGDFEGARHYLPLPTWRWPVRNNISVHPLGGCALADDPDQGVVSARAGSRGQLFGYKGLYVTDGALMPTALGANPSATICALAEWICEEITGLPPDPDLGTESR